MTRSTHKPSNYPRREFKHPDPGTTYCRQCGAVHDHKRWFWDEERRATMTREGVEAVCCPACHMAEEGLFDGSLLLHWPTDFKEPKLQNEVRNLLRNEEKQENEKNPLSRTLSIDELEDEWQVHTTTEFLAEKLGHAVQRAFKGELEIDHLDYEKFTRVCWYHPDHPGPDGTEI